MHPMQTEMLVAVELDQRRREAVGRRPRRRLRPHRVTRVTGGHLVALGDRVARAGRRLEGVGGCPDPLVPCADLR